MYAALIQTVTERAPGWVALLLYLVPAAVALALVMVLIRRRLRRRGEAETNEGPK